MLLAALDFHTLPGGRGKIRCIDHFDHVPPQPSVRLCRTPFRHRRDKIGARSEMPGRPILVGDRSRPARAAVDLLHDVSIAEDRCIRRVGLQQVVRTEIALELAVAQVKLKLAFHAAKHRF